MSIRDHLQLKHSWSMLRILDIGSMGSLHSAGDSGHMHGLPWAICTMLRVVDICSGSWLAAALGHLRMLRIVGIRS